MIGDSLNDIKAAKDAGVHAIGVSYGYGSLESLSSADYVIQSLSELPLLLNNPTQLLDRRNEPRRKVPTAYQEYIEIKVKIADEYIPIKLLDYSEHGIKIECPVPFDPDTERLCTIGLPRSISKEIPMTLLIRHCTEKNEKYFIGTQIKEVGNELWFKVFNKTLEFIAEREGILY